MDFFHITASEVRSGPRKGELDIFPDFIVGRSKDLMIRGGFYAVWDEELGLWSMDEYRVQQLVDKELQEFADKLETNVPYSVKFMRSSASGSWKNFKNFISLLSENYTELDMNLTWANTEVKKDDYVSRRLPYALEAGDISAWDELVGTLYSIEERAKLEWAIGAIVAGDSKTIQKFLVLYGPAGTGKSTILNIIQQLFQGYITSFEAKALGSSSAAFATEVFKSNPLVAIQHDGDLSRIEDNTKLNSIIAHEEMTMNEKYKPSYTARVNAFLFMGTNQPVKISDAKSGIIRRLIDVHPTGVRIPAQHYSALMQRVGFESGAIAHHCLEVYRRMGKNHFNAYRPLEMMLQTDVFFNFVEANYDVFKEQDYTTLSQAYLLYKEYCTSTGIERMLPQYKVREELRNYFEEFKDRGYIPGSDTAVRSLYRGFTAHPFKAPSKVEHGYTLVMEETTSLLDQVLADCPAQYANDEGTPQKRWASVETTLSELDTAKLHYVKVPEKIIVIDFDLTDPDGQKSLERNLAAASEWPATYGELSQGGSGVHLCYSYTGDVVELSPVYSEGIEIKTLLGDSSLRRRVSRCNNVPIGELKQGSLPLKEKKPMLDSQTMKSEASVRNLIERAMRKELNVVGTKSNVDFIEKVLKDAYASGMQYDVSDLKPRVAGFAARSTNQSALAIKTVQKMKWKSEDVDSVEVPEMLKDVPIVFFDVEVYLNLFVVCWKIRGQEKVHRLVNPTAAEIETLTRYRLVGFYNRRYDNHILYAAMQGYPVEKLFELSQKMIVDHNNGVLFGHAYNLSYADIWDFSSIKQSLKRFQVELGLTHVEIDIPWDQPVPPELVDKVVEYCVNDVVTTEAVFEDRYQDFVARQILAELSGLSVNDTTQKHTAKIIFEGDRNPQAKFRYTNLSEEFPGYEFEAGKSSYRGIDPSEGGRVYSKPGIYEDVAVYDIASMHPTTIKVLDLFGPYTKNFVALLDARLAIKRKDFTTARELLGGKLRPFLDNEEEADRLAYALKIVINIVYGLTSAKFDNPFRDIRNKDNIVAKRGALFMIDLQLACEDRGMEVVHIKTDSIKIANATDEDWEFVRLFGEKYGYTFEHEATYSKMALVNDAVYIARVGWAAKASKIGKWEATGAQFAHPYVFKTLFSGEDINFEDLVEQKQVTQGVMYLDLEYDKPPPVVEGMHYLGRNAVVMPVKEGSYGSGVLYRVKDDKLYSVTGTKGFLWAPQELAQNRELETDMSYFEKLADAARKQIEKYGDFDEFTGG